MFRVRDFHFAPLDFHEIKTGCIKRGVLDPVGAKSLKSKVLVEKNHSKYTYMLILKNFDL